MLMQPEEKILQYIRDYFEYDQETGKIHRYYPTPDYWREINGIGSEGYIRIYIKKKEYRGRHICWFLHYGVWPKQELDHRNRIRHDNKIDNLKEATDAEQTANLSTQSKHGREPDHP